MNRSGVRTRLSDVVVFLFCYSFAHDAWYDICLLFLLGLHLQICVRLLFDSDDFLKLVVPS